MNKETMKLMAGFGLVIALGMGLVLGGLRGDRDASAAEVETGGAIEERIIKRQCQCIEFDTLGQVYCDCNDEFEIWADLDPTPTLEPVE